MAERLVSTPAAPEAEVEAVPDTETLISHLKELTESARVDLLHDAANSEDVIQGCLTGLLNARHEIELDDNLFISMGPKNSEAFLMQLKTQLTLVEEEKRKIDSDIAGLINTINEDSAQLHSDLQVMEYSLKLSSSMDVHESQATTLNSKSVSGDLHGGLMCAPEGEKFKVTPWNLQYPIVDLLSSLKPAESAFIYLKMCPTALICAVQGACIYWLSTLTT